ncbi:predicted protein [Sclerotinia sclerotiorum 1980 UF-70]|uniref:F-box domain-containing protein n=1 Tax=Sclerotinia sclerotiorum (strain ATCC 18683 / 1980 / Ss-1) TaxID=665079 RepID=A7EEH0_SCLS1|nr:predicted protein [Sclerotinia sclerotiorum 1980 UF-70]EDO01236.1 predicted protein [Sclerotinia sclerotiorum 1980 UF-70]
MSSLNVSGLCLQKQNKQEYQDDIEVEDTVISPLAEGSSEAACVFEDLPYEITAMIVTRLDPISQICFSLTGSNFRQMFKGLAAFDQYLLRHSDRCHRSLKCYSARLSMPLSIQVSKCGYYIYDVDSGCTGSMPLDYDSVEWGPTLADYLWDESFFWSGGSKWCHECYRILPPTSWEQCEFEKEFWDHVEGRSVGKEEPHKLITNLLARSLIRGVERGSKDYAEVSNPAGFLEEILAVDEATEARDVDRGRRVRWGSLETGGWSRYERGAEAELGVTCKCGFVEAWSSRWLDVCCAVERCFAGMLAFCKGV